MGELFGGMLRQHRLDASLTQEALAERASLSATAIGALERGRNLVPRLSTVRQLARALDLGPSQLAALARAALPDSEQQSVATEAEAWLAGASGDEDRPGTTTAEARAEAGTESQEPSPAAATGGSAQASSAPARADMIGEDLPRGVSLPAVAARRWRTEFAGRGSELERLVKDWTGRRRMIEVVGEAGIGKTRLVTEMAREVFAGGATVLWGRCTEERLGAYLPFIEMLRHLVDHADPAALKRAVGTSGELGRLLPELGERVGVLPVPTRAEADTEQRLLFEAVTGLLAQWLPMLIVIDDLHWADDATLSLLGYLVRHPGLDGLVIVATSRDAELDPRTAGWLAETGRHADVSQLSLTGLPETDLGSLVADLIGSGASAELVDSVAKATDGNPFLAEEMTVHLVDMGMIAGADDGVVLRPDAQSLGVPDRVRKTVVRRLLSLTDDGMELLSVASIIGREFDLALAGTAVELAGPALVDAADDGLLSGLVVETAPGRLAFSHALVQEAVGHRLSHARRATFHRRVAISLEERSADSPDVAADLARHWTAVAAVDPSANSTAAAWAVRAGDVALAAAAADEAIARYEDASNLWASSTNGHADALIRLGQALQYRGRAEEADTRFRQASHLAQALGDVDLQARAAIGLGRRYPYWETDTERIEVMEAALDRLPSDGGLARLTLKGLLVTHLISGFHPAEAARRDELAAELAAVAEDPATGTEELLSLGQTRIYDCIEDPTVLAPVADRLVDVAQRHNDLRVLAQARFAQALAALDSGDRGQLTSSTALYGAAASELDDPREKGQAAMIRSTVAFIEGLYDEAAALSEEAVVLGRASGDFNADLLYYAQGLLRAVDQGQASEVLPLLLGSTDYQHIASFAAGTALCAALAGELDLAREELERLVRSGFEGLPRGADWLAPTAFLAHTCSLVGATAQAEPLLASLSRTPSAIVRVGPLAGWWGPVDHHLGCLQRLLGHSDEAEAHLRAALVAEERLGARPFEARTLAELSRLVGDADAEQASSLAARAAAVARSVGALGIVAEVQAITGLTGAREAAGTNNSEVGSGR
jgi:transcriptional regulator with XRE-family HTH domain/tetratricopeptide (TPR) repeat protein